jgi:hypothetical protein
MRRLRRELESARRLPPHGAGREHPHRSRSPDRRVACTVNPSPSGPREGSLGAGARPVEKPSRRTGFHRTRASRCEGLGVWTSQLSASPAVPLPVDAGSACVRRGPEAGR